VYEWGADPVHYTGKGDLANKAANMKKLIEQQERLMEKLGGK
jgi:hypothetical protein